MTGRPVLSVHDEPWGFGLRACGADATLGVSVRRRSENLWQRIELSISF